MSDKMNIYDCDDLIRHIEAKADENDGVLSEEDAQMIVETYTQSMTQLKKLADCVKYLESFEMIAKAEVERIQAQRKTAKNHIESIKQWLKPFLLKRGTVHIGVRVLGIRKSKGVVLADGFDNPEYCKKEVVIKPDKKLIKQDIENGIAIKGALLEERTNVQIK